MTLNNILFGSNMGLRALNKNFLYLFLYFSYFDDADHDWIYDVIGYLIKLRIIWATSQLEKNSGSLKNT